MSKQNHITQSCIIREKAVLKNGLPFFQAEDMAVHDFLLSLYQSLSIQYPRFYKMDHLSKLGWLATEVLLKDHFDKEKYPAEKVGLVLSNANASLDTDIKYQETINGLPSPSVFVYTLPNIVTGEICIRNQWKGENAFFVTPVFDAALIFDYVSSLLNQNILQACVCGWVELVEEAYTAALFLVERTADGIIFSAESLESLFEQSYHS